MNRDFDDLPYHTSFSNTTMYNHSFSFDDDLDLFYYNQTDRGTMDYAYMAADTLRSAEFIMSYCGLILNVVFVGVVICVMCANRGKRTVIPRLWLVFGMVIAHAIFLLLLPTESLLLSMAMEISNKPLCIFISYIFEACDFTSTFSTMVLSCNVYCSMREPENAASRRATLVWIIAGFAAWVVGFGTAFAIGTADTGESEWHCGGHFTPKYLEIIKFIVSFIAPYTASIFLCCLTIIKWRSKRNEEVTQLQLSERSSVGQVLKLPAQDMTKTSTTHTPGMVVTSSPQLENTENLGVIGTYKGAEPCNTTINVPSTSTAMDSGAKPVCERPSLADGEGRTKTSLKFWVIFTAANVFMSFACRLCISLPIADAMIYWDWQILYYAIVHMLLIIYYMVFPLLCFITVEVRNVRRNCRKCAVCYKICCWCCNCCLETDDE